MRAVLFHVDGLQTDVTKLIVTFRNVANARYQIKLDLKVSLAVIYLSHSRVQWSYSANTALCRLMTQS